MDHAATMRRLYDLINAGDIDGFGELLAEDFVEQRRCRGSSGRRGGQGALPDVRAAFPDLRMEAQDVLVSGDKAVARVRATGTHRASSWACPRPARASTSS